MPQTAVLGFRWYLYSAWGVAEHFRQFRWLLKSLKYPGLSHWRQAFLRTAVFIHKRPCLKDSQLYVSFQQRWQYPFFPTEDKTFPANWVWFLKCEKMVFATEVCEPGWPVNGKRSQASGAGVSLWWVWQNDKHGNTVYYQSWSQRGVSWCSLLLKRKLTVSNL